MSTIVRLSILKVRESPVQYANRTLDLVAVTIDDRELWDRCRPFNADSTEILAKICEECFGVFNGGCNGRSDIFVRRHDDIIFWYLVNPDCAPSPSELNETTGIGLGKYPKDLASNQVWMFSKQSYERELGGSAEALQNFNSDEINLILNRGTIFERPLGLYTIPDVEGDEQGRELLATIKEVIQEGAFTLTRTPAKYTEIRIGIEVPGVPECRLQIGRIDGQCCVRFVQNPMFPIFVTSKEVRRRLHRFCEVTK